MDKEFKFRVLTTCDWDEGTIDGLSIRKDGGLEPLDRDGSYTSKPLDSGIKNCRWHRIVLDADIPDNSTIAISFCSSESEEAAGWSREIVFLDVARDALVQTPPGRYLRLKIDFHREGEETPVMRQAKIYYPGHSYLRYLPSLYQEDPASKEFLARFLSLFESVMYEREETISGIPTRFDPMATPEDFLPWLASWLSLDLCEPIGDKNRDFILRAAELYKEKGTASGIASLVTLLTEKRCCVKEYMNNVFRTYGMEHHDVEELVDERGCMKFHRTMSGTVNTAEPDILTGMDTYRDRVHYVTDTSKTGRYSQNVIGIFIFLAEGERLLIEVDELYRIIKSFLPVFVRAEIVLVEAPSDETYDARVGPANNTKSASTTGVIPDGNGSITYTDEYDGYANMMTGNQNPVHRSGW
jgi:phage tail-like protein